MKGEGEITEMGRVRLKHMTMSEQERPKVTHKEKNDSSNLSVLCLR